MRLNPDRLPWREVGEWRFSSRAGHPADWVLVLTSR